MTYSKTSNTVRPAQFGGACYPANERQLSDLLDSVMKTSQHTKQGIVVKQGATAILAPHIDFRVGLSAYGPAYSALQDSDADVFVVLATSHYGWGDLFVPTFQHFATPIGVVKTDHDIVNALYARLPTLTKDDSAHREEHSIEFEVVFLQHLYGHRPFTIVPILITSFYPFIAQRVLPRNHNEFSGFCDALRTVLLESGKRVAFVASGDMAHIGRKFDDDYDAEPMLPEIAIEDAQLIRAMEQGDSTTYFERIATVEDCYKICGLPPVYTMLELAGLRNGVAVAYEQWNERATRSAVTYASVAYYDAAIR
jgi:MEMO1 family protein